MGIDIGDAHWGYGGFMRFRKHLAREIGVNLDSMAGYAGWGWQESREAQQNAISWSTVEDPIVPLLDHSDCDGDLSVEECRTIVPRLRELVDGWSEDPELNESFDKRQALLLADSMDQCGREGQRLEFR